MLRGGRERADAPRSRRNATSTPESFALPPSELLDEQRPIMGRLPPARGVRFGSVMLRDFLYLDRSLIQDFLSQVEGGLIEEETERNAITGRGGVGGRLSAGPAGVNADRSRETIQETQAVIRQSAASEFDRLYRVLLGEDLVILEEVSQPRVVDEIRRKQFLEVDARVVASGLQQFASIATLFAAIAPHARTLGEEGQLDQESMEKLEALAAMSGQGGAVGVIATVVGEVGLKIGLELDPAWVQVAAWDVEATVLLKVQRRVLAGERYMVGDPFGGLMRLLPAASRAELAAALASGNAKTLGLGEVEITAPAFVGTPIAIYR